MRRGQRAGVAPEFFVPGDGRILLTAAYAAEIAGRPVSTIRDRRGDPTRGEAGPVLCHVATGALYWDMEALKLRMPSVIPRPRRPLGRKGPVGHGTESSRSAT